MLYEKVRTVDFQFFIFGGTALNQRGLWQLILMAQEGDRKAVDELFYMTYRLAFLVAYSVTNNKAASLDIILECYVSLLSSLSDIDEAMNFSSVLSIRVLERVRILAGTDDFLKIKKSRGAGSLRDVSNLAVYDFDTLPGVESDLPANEILDIFFKLDTGRRLCFFLFFFGGASTDDIAAAFDVSEDDVVSALRSAADETFPLIAEIRGNYTQLRHVNVESLIPWALRNNTSYSPDDNELKSFYATLLEKLVDAGALDTTMTDDDEDELIEIDFKDMGTPPKSGFFKSKLFFSIMVAAAFLLVIGLIFIGMRRVREYNDIRAEIERQTSRVTLKYTTGLFPSESLVFSTEYTHASETEITTATETSQETESAEKNTTTAPKEDYGGLSFTESGGSVTIIGFDNSKKALRIPGTINGKTVTAIAENAFFNSGVESVVMPDTINSIGAGAFLNCTNLRNISLSSGITRLTENTFRGCSNLTSVTLPKNLNFISTQAFYKCASLSQIVIPSSVTYLGDWAFAGCSSLKSISIPDGVTYVGQSLFYECFSLERCSFSSASKLAALNEWMFFSCSSLKTFAIPSKVTYVPANCFYGCRKLERMTLSGRITSVDANAFTDCTGLVAVTIPGNVRRIDNSAFSGCSKLDRLNLQNGTSYIGSGAFSGCSALKTAVIPSSVTEIGLGAFAGCINLTIQCTPGSYAESYAADNGISTNP